VATCILQIVCRHQPEVLHVFLHAGDDCIGESKVGLFENKRGCYSPLSKITRDTEYHEHVIRVPSQRGFVAFEVEAVLTEILKKEFRYIKLVNLTVDKWSTVMVNYKLRTGNYTPLSACYVSFGFGLKTSLLTNQIVQNPIGRVQVQMPRLNDAANDAARLAGILFDNRAILFFSDKPFCKSDLRKPACYSLILNLDKCPGNYKITQIYDRFMELIGYLGGYCTVLAGTAAVPVLWVLQMGTAGYCGYCRVLWVLWVLHGLK
jgi:hypothetical protein